MDLESVDVRGQSIRELGPGRGAALGPGRSNGSDQGIEVLDHLIIARDGQLALKSK